MFIKTLVKTDKKIGKRYNYYRLCESYHIGNKVRHRSIVSMGKLNGLFAYLVVATIRYQLKNKGIHHDWKNIV